MPCPHKFIEDLNLENLDFAPTTLIVGTFNPAWPVNNQAEWFYGRTTRNYFWDVLPALYLQPGLRNIPAQDKPIAWTQFCNRHKIAITDLISCINDAHNPEHEAQLNGYADNAIADHFNDFELTNIIRLLQQNPSIENVYLTTKAQIPFFNALWNEIEVYCLVHHIHCQRLLTPSGSARYQIPNGYVPQFPVYNGVLANFILENWLTVWHENNFARMQKAKLIGETVTLYFGENPSIETVPANDLMPQFINAGVFEEEEQNGLTSTPYLVNSTREINCI